MASSKMAEAQILRPGETPGGLNERFRGAGGLFQNENLDLLSRVLDLAAFFRGVPLITIARMVANLGVEVVVGVVPVLGNLFDIGWRANRRNYALLERSLETGRRDTWRDWLFMFLLGLLLMTMAMLPFLLLLWLSGSLLRSLHAPGWR